MVLHVRVPKRIHQENLSLQPLHDENLYLIVYEHPLKVYNLVDRRLEVRDTYGIHRHRVMP